MTKKYSKSVADQKELLKKIIKQISGDIENIAGALEPEFIIIGKGVIYCLEPSSRTFINLNRGTRIYIISYCTNDKVLVYTYNNQIVEIDIKEIRLAEYD